MDWSAPYTAPASVVEGLKRVDPSAELLYLARGSWALVAKPDASSVKDGLARRKLSGRNILRTIRKKGNPDPVTERAAMLVAEGYGIVLIHEWPHAPTHDLVEWFAEADDVAKTKFDEAMDKRMAHSDGRAFEEQVVKTFRDYNATEGVSVYRHSFRGLRHFDQGRQ